MNNRTNNRIAEMVRIALVAAIYVALSMAIAPLSFGQIQFRFSEILMLLVFYNRKYAFSMILGCFIVNIFSPFGWYDMVFGTLATVVACVTMLPFKNIWLASLMPTLSCIIISAEIHFLTAEPFWFTTLTVLTGEFVVVTIIGCPLMKLFVKNKMLVNLVGLNRNLGKKVSEPPTFENHGEELEKCELLPQATSAKEQDNISEIDSLESEKPQIASNDLDTAELNQKQ